MILGWVAFVVCEWVFWPTFYVAGFKEVLNHHKLAEAFWILFSAEMVITFFCVLVYDTFKRDLFGIEHAKRYVKSYFGIGSEWTLKKLVSTTGAFIAMFFLVSAPGLLLLFRKEGKRGIHLSGFFFILMVILIKTYVYSRAHIHLSPYYVAPH